MINPYPLAMVVCDAIWTDPVTGKRTLLGCFLRILSRNFPTSRRVMAVYIALTGGRGTVPMRMQLVDAAETRPPIAQADLEDEFYDPLSVVEMELHLSGMEFPEPGEYALQLYAGNELLVERRIRVERTPGGPIDEQP